MITEQDLHEYNKWLMEVWNPNQLYIPFAIDAPKAFLDHRSKVKNLSSNTVLAEVPKRNFEWVCNECNFPNLTSSVSEDEIEMELHSCINCGCFEMHKRYFR